MVIKVVGVADQHVHTVSCKNCASKLEYTFADTTLHQHTDYGGDTDTYRWLKCPQCQNDINVGCI